MVRVTASQTVISNIVPLTKELKDALSCYGNTKCSRTINEIKERLLGAFPQPEVG